MACQMDPKVYGFMCRCPMEEGLTDEEIAVVEGNGK